MYQFSRSIYRELAPRVIEDPEDPTGCSNKQRVLDACEGTMQRLAQDRRYFAKPTRTLFTEVRPYFSINDQLRVHKVIEAYLGVATDYLDSLPPDELNVLGHKSECQAHTRKGTPCQREPLLGRDYCPSHKHLEETLELAEEGVEAKALVAA